MRHENRQFIPAFNGNYQDRKRVPPGCNIQQVQVKNTNTSDWESRIRIQSWAQSSETNRQSALNSQFYNTSLPMHSQKPETCQRNLIKAKRLDPAPDPNTLMCLNDSVSTSFSSNSNAIRASKPLTSIHPFNLSYEYRPKRPEQPNPSFKFTPREMPNFSDPFKPVLNGGVLTQPQNPSFSTDSRAVQRELFEERLRMNAKAREAELEMKRLQEAQREKEEIMRIRKQMEFKARPVMNSSGLGRKTAPIGGVNSSGLWNISMRK